MAMTLYVGNLPFSADQESVQDLFAAYGDVLSVKLMSERSRAASAARSPSRRLVSDFAHGERPRLV